MRRIVVIAAGMPGISCAARIKHLLPDCELNLVLPAPLPDQEPEGDRSNGDKATEQSDYEALRPYGISAMEARDIMPDLPQREITLSADRGRLTIRYTDLVVEAPAAVRLPHALQRVENVFAWPLPERNAPAAALHAALLASGEKNRAVIVTGNGLPALEAVCFVRQAGLKALWLRTGENAPDVEPHLLALILKRLGRDVACIPLPGVASGQLVCSLDGAGRRLERISPPGGDPADVSACLWTAPLMARHPLLREDGVTLDAFGRIDTVAEAAGLNLRFIGSGAAVPPALLAGGAVRAPVYPGGDEAAALSAALAVAGLRDSGDGGPFLPQGALRARALRSPDMFLACGGFTLAEAQALGRNAEQAVVSLFLPDSQAEASRLVLALIGDGKSRAPLGAQVLCLGRDSAAAEGLFAMALAALADGTRIETLMQRAWSGLPAGMLGNAAGVLADKWDTVVQGITPDEFLASRHAGAEFFTLDLRARAQWAGGCLPDAYNIPLPQLKKRLQDEVPRFTPLVLVCATGDEARATAVGLAAMGATDLYALDGGMDLWPYSLNQ
ncbi:MAG: rhodanese-like domain-containing protein [Desulfovibrio sp.]|jgi:rhodanese-related sulfurtransferase|nr:rhodanese-like domain-containing protein [Desulfovibrio sp.]